MGLTYDAAGKPTGFTYQGKPVPTGSVWGKTGIQTSTPVTGYGQLPYGSYDPSIYVNAQLANLGLANQHEDYNLAYGANGTARQDLATALARASQDYGLSNDSLQRGEGRGLADLLTARQRGDEDYQNQIKALQRQYDILGENQLQAVNQAGDTEGGALAQALQKRTANQAIDRAPLDTNYQRFVSDNTLAQQRLQEDANANLAGLQLSYGRGTGDYQTQFDRGMAAAQLGVGRAEGSNAIYQGGALAQAILQASPTLATDPRFQVGPNGVGVVGTTPYAATTYTDQATGKVYTPAKGVSLAPGWKIVNGRLVRA